MRVAVHQSQPWVHSSTHSSTDSEFGVRKGTTSPAPAQLEAAETFQVSDCEVRLASREVIRAGVPQKVERLTFDLIVYLIVNRGRVVSKEELLRNVWRNMFVSDSVITQSIMKARRTLGDDGNARIFIRTVHRVGYKFEDESVRALPAAQQTSDDASDLSPRPQQMSLDEAGRETLAKAAEVMARELTRLGLTVRPVHSDEAAPNALDMAEHIGLALHKSLTLHRSLLVDIATNNLRRSPAI